MAKTALYLAGGGARGAYQAGVLKAINQVLSTKTIPFSVITGVSVGSINAAILAQHPNNFDVGVERLENLWRDITFDQIFKASQSDLAKSILRSVSYFFRKQKRPGYLLDTTPLTAFIKDNIDFDLIKNNINATDNPLETMEVISHCYETQQTISFYQHNKPDFTDWHYPRHISERVEIGLEHILASSALPLFFPTVHVNGFHFGDGSMGLVAPLRGTLRFNSSRILIIGTRQPPTLVTPDAIQHGDIGLAHILGNMLNGLFLDNLDHDIEMVNRMNDIARLLSMWKKRHSPWRPVQTLHFRPSMDIAQIAQSKYRSIPKLLRLFLNNLGAKSHGGDLLSFLLFENGFSTELLELGYNDGLASANAIMSFFTNE